MTTCYHSERIRKAVSDIIWEEEGPPVISHMETVNEYEFPPAMIAYKEVC